MTPGKHLFPMPGLELWVNEKNGFFVFQAHYHADPIKRDPKYIEEIKQSMPVRQFKQEYELQWDSFEGLAVYADWDITVHGVKNDIQPQLGLPLLLGLDFGLTPACVVCQMQEDTLCVLREYTAVNMGAKRFMAWITPQLKIAYHMWQNPAQDYLVFIDPSGEFRKDTDEGTCSIEVAEAGFRNIVPGPVAWEERRTSVEHFLTKRTRMGPCFQVSLPNCPILSRGFQGGYRYSDKVLESEPNKIRPKKDVYSHCFKAGVKVATPSGEIQIQNLKVGQLVETPVGPRKIVATMKTKADAFTILSFRDGSTLECTPDHPIWDGNTFLRADALTYGSTIYQWDEKPNIQSNFSEVFRIIASRMGTIKRTIQSAVNTCIEQFGRIIEGVFQRNSTSIIKTEIKQITGWIISNCYTRRFTPLVIAKQGCLPIQKWLSDRSITLENLHPNGIVLLRGVNGIASMRLPWLEACLGKYTNASSARASTTSKKGQGKKDFAVRYAETEPGIDPVSIMSRGSANNAHRLLSATKTLKRSTVVSVVQRTQESVDVYDLTVDDAHCFYANNVLVSNCQDALQMVTSRILITKPASPINIPELSYVWGSDAY